MWIRRKQYELMCDRIDDLMARVKKHDNRYYVDGNGLLNGWNGAGFTLTDALNAMAVAQGFRWQQTHPVEAKIVASPVGKSEVQK